MLKKLIIMMMFSSSLLFSSMFAQKGTVNFNVLDNISVVKDVYIYIDGKKRGKPSKKGVKVKIPEGNHKVKFEVTTKEGKVSYVRNLEVFGDSEVDYELVLNKSFDGKIKLNKKYKTLKKDFIKRYKIEDNSMIFINRFDNGKGTGIYLKNNKFFLIVDSSMKKYKKYYPSDLKNLLESQTSSEKASMDKLISSPYLLEVILSKDSKGYEFKYSNGISIIKVKDIDTSVNKSVVKDAIMYDSYCGTIYDYRYGKCAFMFAKKDIMMPAFK